MEILSKIQIFCIRLEIILSAKTRIVVVIDELDKFFFIEWFGFESDCFETHLCSGKPFEVSLLEFLETHAIPTDIRDGFFLRKR